MGRSGRVYTGAIAGSSAVTERQIETSDAAVDELNSLVRRGRRPPSEERRQQLKVELIEQRDRWLRYRAGSNLTTEKSARRSIDKVVTAARKEWPERLLENLGALTTEERALLYRTILGSAAGHDPSKLPDLPNLRFCRLLKASTRRLPGEFPPELVPTVQAIARIQEEDLATWVFNSAIPDGNLQRFVRAAVPIWSEWTGRTTKLTRNEEQAKKGFHTWIVRVVKPFLKRSEIVGVKQIDVMVQSQIE